MTPFDQLPEDQLLGLCIDRESRGEPTAGRIAVGSVVLNRVAFGKLHKSWGMLYGNDIKSVILAPAQFSWVTPAGSFDENHQGAVEIAKDFKAALKSKEYGQWLYPCYSIAQGLIGGRIPVSTSAMYYHEIHIHPKWAEGKIPLLTIGNHIFYG